MAVWHEHDGWDNPVPKGVDFRVRIRAVSEEHANKGPWYSNAPGWTWKWNHSDPALGDITHYQLKEGNPS